MKKIFWVMFAVVLSGVMMNQAMALDMKDGKWEMTMRISQMNGVDDLNAKMAEAMKQIENLPAEYRAMVEAQMKEQNITFNKDGVTTIQTQCLDQYAPVPNMVEAKEQGCAVSQDVQGNTVSFKVSCPHEEGAENAEGEMTYTFDTMQGEVKNYSLLKGEKSNETIVKISGHYIGECDTNNTQDVE